MDTDDFNDILEKEFTAIDGTSIDYAVMKTTPMLSPLKPRFPR